MCALLTSLLQAELDLSPLLARAQAADKQHSVVGRVAWSGHATPDLPGWRVRPASGPRLLSTHDARCCNTLSFGAEPATASWPVLFSGCTMLKPPSPSHSLVPAIRGLQVAPIDEDLVLVQLDDDGNPEPFGFFGAHYTHATARLLMMATTPDVSLPKGRLHAAASCCCVMYVPSPPCWPPSCLVLPAGELSVTAWLGQRAANKQGPGG